MSTEVWESSESMVQIETLDQACPLVVLCATGAFIVCLKVVIYVKRA